jgi:hypothetical protein
MFVRNVEPGKDNTTREYPFPNVHINLRLDFSGPFTEREEIDCGKGINTVDGA